jgi:hypothetical protein
MNSERALKIGKHATKIWIRFKPGDKKLTIEKT